MTYRLSGEKKKVWKNHLSPLQKAFYISCFVFTVYHFLGGLLSDRPQFSLGSETFIPKKCNNNKDNDNTMTWLILKFSYLGSHAAIFCRISPRSWKLDQKKHNSASCCTWVWNISDIVVKWPATLKTALRRKKRWWWCPTKEKQRFRAEEIQRNFETLVVGAQRLSSIPAFLGLCSSLNHQRLVHHSKSSQQQFLYVITSSL